MSEYGADTYVISPDGLKHIGVGVGMVLVLCRSAGLILLALWVGRYVSVPEDLFFISVGVRVINPWVDIFLENT